MACAFKSGNSWVVKIRGFRQPPGLCRQWRVQLAEVPDPSAHAKRCEALCRELEALEGMAPPALVNEAIASGAIPQDVGLALLGESAAEERKRNDPFSIRNLAAAHPSSRREESTPRDYDRHLADLERFLAWRGIEDVRELALADVVRYIEDLQAAGYETDTIRHRLLWLKRASRMAATIGVPDVLSRFVLVRRPKGKRRPLIAVWSVEQLVRAMDQLEASGNLRAAAAVALGGLMGLRPTELMRAHVVDIRGGILEVGAREAKNESSHRFLPVPLPVLGVLERLTAANTSEDVRRAQAAAKRKRAFSPSPFLIRSASRRSRGGEFELNGFTHWLRPVLLEATGTELPAKNLRKSFATWVRSALPLGERDLLEAWMGHETSLSLPVTSRSYLAELQAEQLRPIAVAIEAAVAATRASYRAP